MKTLIVIVAVLLVLVVARRLFAGPSLPPEEAEKRVATGAAVLIDVREPAEWASGVAKPAVLLPLSDLTGGRSQWKPFLEQNCDRELIVYCRSGGRSGIAAVILRGEGFKVSNAGSFDSWQSAGLPTRKP
ncbi:MAG: rhodanese-like domain-containing protein [Verrucomicrobiae bacterium]